MFEGLYFQFPKLGFILFFFLACEALCPLRANALYFPRTPFFGEVGVKSSLALWILKWAMITFLIIALMSPVRDHPHVRGDVGKDILLILDPKLSTTEVPKQIAAFVNHRPNERLALWIPENTIVPLTHEHEILNSVLLQSRNNSSEAKVDRRIERFFATSKEGKKWILIFTNRPKSFIEALPEGIQTAIVTPDEEPDWEKILGRSNPPFRLEPSRRYFDYYYIYPLFLGFMAMLAYLYGRNQKGLK